MVVSSEKRFRNGKDPERRDGMALFVALVVVMILYVLVYQLWHCSIIETRIVRNQGGYMKAALAMRSAVAYAISLIQEDLVQDVEEKSGTSLGTGSAGLSPAADTPGPGIAAPKLDPSALSKSGAGKVGAGGGVPKLGGWYDYINESIFQPRRQRINDIDVKIEISDGESRINLNKLWGYVSLWQNETTGVASVADREAEAARAAGLSPEDLKGGKKKASGAASGEDKLADILGAGAMTPSAEEEEEWVEPDPEERKAAQRLIADCIIHMVESNIENGFVYQRLYEADMIAERIEQYVFERKSADEQNFIFTTAELLQVEGVTPELYNGPMPPELINPDEALEPGEEGYRRDDFGDIVYDFGLAEEEDFYGGLAGSQGGVSPDTLGGPGGLDQLRGLAELGGLDPRMLRGSYGAGGGFTPGLSSYASTPYPDNEDGTGIVRPPKPIGLKDLFCTFSSGKININTAPMEVLMALMQGGGDPTVWNPEDKLMVGRAIVDYRNQYTEEYLKELEEEETQDYGSGYGVTDETAYEESLLGASGTEDLRTNYFTSLRDLEKIKVDDEEILKTGVDSGRTERSLGWLVRKDLRKAAAFNSEYFIVRVVAKQKDFREEAEFVVHRDIKKKIVSVEYYRERQD